MVWKRSRCGGEVVVTGGGGWDGSSQTVVGSLSHRSPGA